MFLYGGEELPCKAIMAVRYSLPVDMDPVLELCHRYDLKLIEDTAEMIGQTYHGKPCGSFGDISTVSFYPNKHITTGEGGMVLTDDDDLALQCRSYVTYVLSLVSVLFTSG